jgi:hypothetical protein
VKNLGRRRNSGGDGEIKRRKETVERFAAYERQFENWLEVEGMEGAGPAIALGLMYFFGYEMQRAESRKQKNAIVMARFLLEQYILLGIRHGPAVYAKDRWMMKRLGVGSELFYQAKGYLTKKGLIRMKFNQRQTSTSGKKKAGTFEKSYVELKVRTWPMLSEMLHERLEWGSDLTYDDGYEAEEGAIEQARKYRKQSMENPQSGKARHYAS